ncbi:MAG: 50S ribosomal protein L28 [Thermoanaerobaculia bacterium]
MSKQCHYCGKRTVAGGSISHAHNVTKRQFRPNLQKVRALVDGAPRRVLACTRCLRSGRVTKVPARDWAPEETASP